MRNGVAMAGRCLAVLLAAVPAVAFAGGGGPVALAGLDFDFLSVEAYIADHKAQYPLLLCRASLERANALAHGETARTVQAYEDLNDALDLYTRAFDVLSLLYAGLRAADAVASTAARVSARAGDYASLLADYGERVAGRDRVEPRDTIILAIGRDCIRDAVAEARSLCSSFTDLALYATGAQACTTATLAGTLDRIESSLERVARVVDRSYHSTLLYVRARTSAWKAGVTVRPRGTLADEAFSRWKGRFTNPFAG